MIVDNIQNAHKYIVANPALRAAFEVLKRMTEGTEAGRYEIDARNYVNVFSYESNPRENEVFEDHRVYADIHFIILGEENIDVIDAEQTALTEDRYQSEDVALCRAESGYSILELHRGDFAVIFPGEAHRPGIAIDDRKEDVKKAVAKIRVDSF